MAGDDFQDVAMAEDAPAEPAAAAPSDDVDMQEGDAAQREQPASTTQAPFTDMHTAFVKNLSYKIKQGELDEFFKPCGELKEVRLIKDKATGRLKVRHDAVACREYRHHVIP